MLNAHHYGIPTPSFSLVGLLFFLIKNKLPELQHMNEITAI